ncbi:MAG: SRPBCC family protein [Actinomycetota bacterium]
MAQATFSHTVNIAVSNQQAWDALQNHHTWANIGPVSSVSNPVNQPDGILKSFDWVADVGGKAYDGKAWATAYDALNTYNLTMDTSEIAGDVAATIAPLGDSCDVTIQITFRTKGMLSAMFFPAIKTALASGFPQQVEDLATAVEAGA